MKKILIINSGSATLKFKIFSFPALTEELFGIIERIGLAKSFLEVSERISKSFIRQTIPEGIKNHSEAFSQMVKKLKKYLPEIKFVGHRVVHGGERFITTTRVNQKVVERLKKYSELAPLHNPVNLACVDKSLELIPKSRQFAIFDTAYYQTIPDYAYLYALPERFYQQYGIRRYGFHGISHKYAAIEGAKKIKKSLKKLKIITCHLGSGASITATKFGEAIDTTMGFTPLEGLTMSTRAGDLDATIPLYLIENYKMAPAEISRIFNQESGLFAIAGTMDMREILTAAGKEVIGYHQGKKFNQAQKKKAVLALKMFIYDIVRYLGQFAAIMGGVDLIVFTGGIGERSPVVRQLILKKMRHWRKLKSVVVPANEELMMAREIVGKL